MGKGKNGIYSGGGGGGEESGEGKGKGKGKGGRRQVDRLGEMLCTKSNAFVLVFLVTCFYYFVL